jgi:hypothetical protein
VVTTYNPAMARKQTYALECKLDTNREQLLSMRTKVLEQQALGEPRCNKGALKSG